MTIPTLLDYPLQAAPLAEERLPLRGADPTPLLLALVKQGFSLIRSSEAWRKGKAYGSTDEPFKGGKVITLSCPSDMDGRLKKCAWHARFSQHKPKDSGLDFDDFFFGLGSEHHTPNEAEYVPDVVEALKIDEIVPGRAEIWRNSYHLSVPTSNRDFLELVFTLPLPPSPAPFSCAHEEVVVRQLSTSRRLATHPGNPSQGRRSFIVVSVPVLHHDAPERKEFVRAKYASVEGVWEGQTERGTSSAEERQIEWFMAVQSDTAGKVPLLFQEMAMAGKIWQDVPLFFEWLRKKKSQLGKQPSSAAATNVAAAIHPQTTEGNTTNYSSSSVSPSGGPKSHHLSEAQSQEAGAAAVGSTASGGDATTHGDRQQVSDQGYSTAQDEFHPSHADQRRSSTEYAGQNSNRLSAAHDADEHPGSSSTDPQTISSNPESSAITSATPAGIASTSSPSYPSNASKSDAAPPSTSSAAPPLPGNYVYGASGNRSEGAGSSSSPTASPLHHQGDQGDKETLATVTQAEHDDGENEHLDGSYGDGTAPSFQEQLARRT